MSLLDLDERLVALAAAVEITSSPITDFKKPPEVDVGIVEGSVSNTVNIEVLKELREKCKILVAMGDCACFGGIPAMRNLVDKEAALRRGYVETESKVMPLHEVVKVDVHLPGCPPSADAIYYTLSELVAGRIPVLAGENLRYD